MIVTPLMLMPLQITPLLARGSVLPPFLLEGQVGRGERAESSAADDDVDAAMQGEEAIGRRILLTRSSYWGWREQLRQYDQSLCYAFRNIEIEIQSDSLMLTEWVMDIHNPPWNPLEIIEDIQNRLSNLENWSIHHCFREGNKFVDILANWG
ncbi:hypothetical protein RND71_025569 [Anisodus tanguticus]|uniref:RNase H type-1 domain-containing protein n=1 Tax=Anisodus tanguticus TaxID=243964 RepID=A0AAE1RTA6_9SOLA|nr:hypothetical protein RND71_025569 [Anisodus tanguticus]